MNGKTIEHMAKAATFFQKNTFTRETLSTDLNPEKEFTTMKMGVCIKAALKMIAFMAKESSQLLLTEFIEVLGKMAYFKAKDKLITKMEINTEANSRMDYDMALALTFIQMGNGNGLDSGSTIAKMEKANILIKTVFLFSVCGSMVRKANKN